MLIIVGNYLTKVKQCLTMFFSKNYVLLGRSPLDEAETSKELLKKQKYEKFQRLTHLSNIYSHKYLKIAKF